MEYLFNYNEGNLLIRLLIAHVLADFVIQSKKIVEIKESKPFGVYMWLHIVSVFLFTFFLSGYKTLATLIISISHAIVDISKSCLIKKYKTSSGTIALKLGEKRKLGLEIFTLFILDQILHVIFILIAWLFIISKPPFFQPLFLLLKSAVTDYKISLIFLGYLVCTWPSAFFIEKLIKKILLESAIKKSVTLSPESKYPPIDDTDKDMPHGGHWIGIFERLIIISFVFLKEYEAIVFLITGKSIIRFAERDKMQSEYVLVGTMLSYAIAIITGIFINWLLAMN